MTSHYEALQPIGPDNEQLDQLTRHHVDNPEVALAVRHLRQETALSQHKFAKLVGKPQSTIARIEAGSMNVSVKVLRDIATAAGKELSVKFVNPATNDEHL